METHISELTQKKYSGTQYLNAYGAMLALWRNLPTKGCTHDK